MKNLLPLILLTIALNSFSQKPTKEDSLLQVEARNFADSSFKRTTIEQFMGFMFENVSAKDYSQIDRWWGTYLQAKYNEFLQRKKLQPKPKQ